MAKLKAALKAVKEKLSPNRRLLSTARRRYKANRKRAYRANEQKIAALKHADELRAESAKYLAFGPDEDQAKGERLIRQADRLGDEAKRHAHVAYRNHLRAQHFLGVTKKLNRRLRGVEAHASHIEAEIKKLRAKVNGNVVEGGTPRQRWMLAFLTMVANCANGTRRNFYSMTGLWDILRELVGGPEYGHRSDCSSTVTGGAHAAQLPDPNGQDYGGGWTETLMSESNGWRKVSEAAMRKKGWGYIVYVRSWEDTEGHHTEAYTPSEEDPDRTSGHGTDAVDFGTVDDFGDGLFHCFIYDPE
jgi:hypothetical protein